MLLPEAFRSLSRLSSALSAKASALRSFCVTSTFSSVRMFGLFLGSSLILDVSLATYSRMLLDVSIFTCSFKFINFYVWICFHVCSFQGTAYIRKKNHRQVLEARFHKLVFDFLCSTRQCRDRTSSACEVRMYCGCLLKHPSGDEEIRTLDPLLARQVLSQLS